VPNGVKWILQGRLDSHATALTLSNTSHLFLQFQRDRGEIFIVPSTTLYADSDLLDTANIPDSVLSTLITGRKIPLPLLPLGSAIQPEDPRISVENRGLEWLVSFNYKVTFSIFIESNNNEDFYSFSYGGKGIGDNKVRFADKNAYDADDSALSQSRIPDHVSSDLGINSDWKVELVERNPGGADWLLTRNAASGIFLSAGMVSSYDNGKTALDVLNERRPDLVNIEFSCENTKTTLPYVDLATEVMESAISSAFPRIIPIDPVDVAGVVLELNQGQVNARLANSPYFVPPLPADTVVKVVTGNRQWEILRPDRRYGVRTGLSVSRDHGWSSSLATKTVQADIKDLNTKVLPASIREFIPGHEIASGVFGRGAFFPTIDNIKITAADSKWTVAYRYSVQISEERGGLASLLIGPEAASFRASIPNDRLAEVFDALSNLNVPEIIRNEFFRGKSWLSVELRYENEFERGYEIWAQHTLNVDYHQLAVAWDVPQTSESSDKIASQPEHFDTAAYQVLQSAGYPWSLPFDLPLDEARSYLSHLGASLAQLKEMFDRKVDFQAPEFAPFSDARFRAAPERCGFTAGDLEIISGRQTGTGGEGAPDSGLWNFWGFKSTTLSPTNSIPDPCDATRRIEQGQNWLDVC
jgi:hypothetical protein